MGYSVPKKKDGKDAGATGLKHGGALALGEIAGRAVLGRGVGTGVGGIAAAAANSDGTERTVQTIIAVERAANELSGGSGA